MDVGDQEKLVIQRLKEEREKQKLSQLELSYRSGVSQNMIAYIEGGKRTPTLTTIIKLCNALSISPSVLFLEVDSERDEIKERLFELIRLL